MKRIEICSYGPLPQCVRFAEGDLPAVGDHDILVKVVAVSVNPIDYKIANGDLRRVLRLNLPAPFGFDCCGRVEALGSKVIGYEVGNLVYARAPRERMGAFAEFVAIESRYVAKAPISLSAQAAASLPLVALTTVQALVDRAKARKGQSVLIHAGSGGLGSFAIQYAKNELGLHVTTTTSSRNAHWVRELGADVVVAYDRENYASLPARYDIGITLPPRISTVCGSAPLNRRVIRRKVAATDILAGREHETPRFECDMSHRGRPGLALVDRRGAVDPDTLGIHSRAQQRHVILPTEESSHFSGGCVENWRSGAAPQPP